MSNRRVADGATASNPITITKGDMFDLMPYENSLVAFELNGAQLKNILERGYRNYWYYKYVPGYGGLSHYTTCMLDISMGGIISYTDPGPNIPPNGNNVVALSFDGTQVMFTEDYTYTVSTVNYIAAGSCNFNDDGETIWPLDQITADTQYYVRDSVVDYVGAQTGPIAPMVEGRLQFLAGPDLSTSTKTVVDAGGDGEASAGEILTYTINLVNTSDAGAAFMLTDTLPSGVTYVPGSLNYNGFPDGTVITITSGVLTAMTANFPSTPDGGSFTIVMPGIIRFEVMVDDPLPAGDEIVNAIELVDQDNPYDIAPATIPLARCRIYLPLVMRAYSAP
jgi:uncharacterized repeat protein (TIGR01451 family)